MLHKLIIRQQIVEIHQKKNDNKYSYIDPPKILVKFECLIKPWPKC